MILYSFLVIKEIGVHDSTFECILVMFAFPALFLVNLKMFSFCHGSWLVLVQTEMLRPGVGSKFKHIFAWVFKKTTNLAAILNRNADVGPKQ